MEDTQG